MTLQEISMKKSSLVLVLLMSVFFSMPRATFAQDARERASLLVDDDRVQCPTAQYTTIQSAVNNARPGDVIHVCPGTYAEQVVISKRLHIEADNGAIVMPDGMSPNAIDVSSGDPLAVVILVQNTQDVNIEGLIVDGTSNGLTGCSPDLIGILYQNASGHIEHNAIRHLKLSTALLGCQSGEAITAQSGSGGNATVEISDNSVGDYQKNGITGNESGTQITIRENVVTGAGPTTGAAQNGIQVGFGAQGEVKNNSVANNVWSPCVSVDQCDFNATGILIFQSNGVDVEDNSVGTNQVGIAVEGQNTQINSNIVFNSPVLSGILLIGDDNEVKDNQITHSDQDGIFVQGNGNQISGNEVTEALVGIFKVSGFTGNTLSHNNIFATLIPILDPAPTKTIRPVPVR
jgi:parallel beta-helix repeat protein